MDSFVYIFKGTKFYVRKYVIIFVPVFIWCFSSEYASVGDAKWKEPV